MYIKYTHKNFKEIPLLVIERANEIIEDFAAQGYDLTLRQLYYQFIATDSLPDEWLVDIGNGQFTKNHEKNYKKLGKLITDARLAGLVSWKAIEDRTREPVIWQTDREPVDALNRAIKTFSLDPWLDQPECIEIWVEKEALSGIFEQVARNYTLPLFCCRGYHSSSSAWNAAQRIKNYDKPTTVLHFGDHDPSGIDMTRDIEERFRVFGAHNVTIQRCALNLDQVHEFDPPPSPAKLKDPRAQSYVDIFGDDSWELDALSPRTLQQIAHGFIQDIMDNDIWEETEEREADGKAELEGLRDYL